MKKEKIVLESVKLAEIYKAGYIDGFSAGRRKPVKWKSIYKKCGKAFNKRFLNR